MLVNLITIWHNYKKWLVLGLAIFLLCVLIITFFSFGLDYLYASRFYPGTAVGQVRLGGLTMEQSQKIFRAKSDEFNHTGQIFFYQDKKIILSATQVSLADPDLSQEIIGFNFEDTLEQAYLRGRQGSFLQRLVAKISLLFSHPKSWSLRWQEVMITKILQENFSSFEKPGHNPLLVWSADGSVTLEQEKVGLQFDYELALSQFHQNLMTLEFPAIELKLKLKEPDFHINEAWPELSAATDLIERAPIKIIATTTNEFNRPANWSLSLMADDLKKILILNWSNIKAQVILDFDQQALEKFLEPWRSQIEQPIKEAKFSLTGDKVTEFQAAQSGVAIDFPATLDSFRQSFIYDKKNTAVLITKKTIPQISTENVNDLGIKELIGVGESNYRGSPVNRRHNIKVGAESLNGLIIKPGEEFSLNQALGDITAAKGYLPELVIKGDKTVPEYGGGLCQIATTAFRLVINTGLPITERKPHAYRVSYYEPAGTDATIYAPHPDLKFINDTFYHLLLQTKNDPENNTVRFEFWSTTDGRQVATTTPKIFNIVRPAGTKYIETTDLAPEKIKCTEIAHNGADTEFTRTITYADGQIKEEIWSSHYRPWQAVCLVGIDPAKATSTEPIITP